MKSTMIHINHSELLIYYSILCSILLIAVLILAIGLLNNYLGMFKEKKNYRKSNKI